MIDERRMMADQKHGPAISREHRQAQKAPEAQETPEASITPETSPRTIRTKGATVTFNVSVPEGTGQLQRDVYLAGSLREFSPNLPDWDPSGLRMQKIDDSHWTITIMGQENAVVEYKYTLGDWKHIEKSAGCDDVPNRRLVTETLSTGPQTIQDTVEGWQNMAPCDT